ncbi:hypothetical protein A2U01_0053072, partial [Trifolium medium]|nr:hypothetical protein [Trifolium medium]
APFSSPQAKSRSLRTGTTTNLRPRRQNLAPGEISRSILASVIRPRRQFLRLGRFFQNQSCYPLRSFASGANSMP